MTDPQHSVLAVFDMPLAPASIHVVADVFDLPGLDLPFVTDVDLHALIDTYGSASR